MAGLMLTFHANPEHVAKAGEAAAAAPTDRAEALGKTPVQILDLLGRHPNLTVPELAGQLSKSDSAVLRGILKLQQEGVFEASGITQGRSLGGDTMNSHKRPETHGMEPKFNHRTHPHYDLKMPKSNLQAVKSERDTQNRVIALFRDALGYRYLGNRSDRTNNSNIDKYLLKMCRKDRLIELIHDFVLFDGGYKKLPRVHQYFGIKASQKRLLKYLGGIIWHTQGSGKSIVMVLLAKWILENMPKARVLILTDRDELDKQIKRVFEDSGEEIHRTSSGRDLMTQLGQAKPRLLCSLIHKFGRKGVDDFDAFIEELKQQASPPVGELFVFVDECHRTQSGKLHKTMKALMPGAVFIGFTGTPLLKADKEATMEVFGTYIHTYKFGEAVLDEVVLDLVYEARDIEQQLVRKNRKNTPHGVACDRV